MDDYSGFGDITSLLMGGGQPTYDAAFQGAMGKRLSVDKLMAQAQMERQKAMAQDDYLRNVTDKTEGNLVVGGLAPDWKAYQGGRVDQVRGDAGRDLYNNATGIPSGVQAMTGAAPAPAGGIGGTIAPIINEFKAMPREQQVSLLELFTNKAIPRTQISAQNAFNPTLGADQALQTTQQGMASIGATDARANASNASADASAALAGKRRGPAAPSPAGSPPPKSATSAADKALADARRAVATKKISREAAAKRLKDAGFTESAKVL